MGYVGDLLRCCRKLRTLDIGLDSPKGVKEGSLVEIAREGCELKKLKLSHGYGYGAKEWKDALKIFGERLETLHIYFYTGCWEFSEKMEILEVILGSIMEYNGGLKYIKVDAYNLIPDDENRAVRVDSLRRFLSRVQDALPLLNKGKLCHDLVKYML